MPVPSSSPEANARKITNSSGRSLAATDSSGRPRPPVRKIFIWSAPASSSSTAVRKPSCPEATADPKPCPWPPATVNARPAPRLLGATARPAAAAGRTARSALLCPCAHRIVVIPASSACRVRCAGRNPVGDAGSLSERSE
jgi:hypothetical protein